jgi:hypothetical protein
MRSLSFIGQSNWAPLTAVDVVHVTETRGRPVCRILVFKFLAARLHRPKNGRMGDNVAKDIMEISFEDRRTAVDTSSGRLLVVTRFS